MITEDYVSFETAKLLKEKGFKGEGEHFYENNKIVHYINYWDRITPKQRYEAIEAPTIQMAMKWLRKNHQIFIRPNTSFLYPIKWYSEIFCYGDNLKTQQDIKTEYYDSPEESCEAAIKYCLEHLI